MLVLVIMILSIMYLCGLECMSTTIAICGIIAGALDILCFILKAYVKAQKTYIKAPAEKE